MGTGVIQLGEQAPTLAALQTKSPRPVAGSQSTLSVGAALCPGQSLVGTVAWTLCSLHPSPQPIVAEVRGAPETGLGLGWGMWRVGESTGGMGQSGCWPEQPGLWPVRDGAGVPGRALCTHTVITLGRGWSWTQAGSQGLGDKGQNRQNGFVEKNNSWFYLENGTNLSSI